jgi:hypothetical protein
MKGVIWKYYPKVNSPDLRDEMGRYGCEVANPDPDFWENSFPIWAICGPWVRATLEPEDVLFFTPALIRSRRAGLPDYICTGYLTVSDVLRDSHKLLDNLVVTARYKRNYRADLRAHLNEDLPKTAELRRRNIVLGDQKLSQWFGNRGRQLNMLVPQSGIGNLDLYARRIRNLSELEAQNLRARLTR